MFNQPEIDQRRINIFGSLTKATDFDCEYLYIDFEFVFPATKYSTAAQAKQEESNLKYSTHCNYYMKLGGNTKTYNFASIFELEMIENLSEKCDVSPVIYFEANSVDYWNRHRIEGYGMLPLDLHGEHRVSQHEEICIPMWRPVGCIKEEMLRFFIGGGKRLKDKKSISVPVDKGNFNARCNWTTIHTGNIYLDLNVISIYNQSYISKKLAMNRKTAGDGHEYASRANTKVISDPDEETEIGSLKKAKLGSRLGQKHSKRAKKSRLATLIKASGIATDSKTETKEVSNNESGSDVENINANHGIMRRTAHSWKRKKTSTLFEKIHRSD